VSFLHANGHRLEYRRIPGEAPTLVFLHEGLGSVALWKDFPDAVAAATGNEAFVYSRHGYGASDGFDAPLTPDYMHREAFEMLPEVLDAASISRPLLIGHSDGASIALMYASQYPVQGLVLMGGHVFVEDLTLASIAALIPSFAESDLAERFDRYHSDGATTFRRWTDAWLDPAFRNWNIEDYLSSVTAPVLVIQGEDDEFGTVAQVRAIESQVSGLASSILLPDCGHSPHVDQRDAVISAIRQFVRTNAEVKAI
jgi:pimeloyl-ACP methyl ester carboxylesterase